MASVSSGVVAGCFALSAFALAIVAGLAADNPASTILLRALGVVVVCWPIGYVAGILCRRVIESDEAPGEQAGEPPAADDVQTPIDTETAEIPAVAEVATR